MEYKKEILTDIYDLDLSLNYETEELIWNVNDNATKTCSLQL